MLTETFIFLNFTYNGGGFDDVHHLLQSLQVWMIMSKLSLLVIQMASSLFERKNFYLKLLYYDFIQEAFNQTLYLYNEAFRVDHPNPLGSVFSGYSLFGHGHHEEVGNAQSCLVGEKNRTCLH